MKKPLSELISEKLDIPKDILMSIPRITAVGNRELVIENYFSLYEYTSDVIKIKAPDYILKIDGTDLKLSLISREALKISGIFAQISFEN